jgi:hypothetical protein
MAPSQVVSGKWPSEVRLTMLDGDKIRLADPTVSNGEIVGHPLKRQGAGNRRVVRSDTLHVPTDSVARIETRDAYPAGTVGLVLTLGLLVAGAVAFVVGIRNWGGG